jgi:two-component system, response regulator PdtaR
MPGHVVGLKGALRVLIVDDELLIADYIASVLEEAGHTVVGMAATADQAQKLLRDTGADVALLDITLKGDRDGVELAQAIRTEHGLPHIFISGSGDPQTRQRAEDTNPLAFLQKPFKGAQLLVALMGVHSSGVSSGT